MHITSGELRMTFSGESITLHAGDTLVLPPKSPYSYTYTGGEALGYLWTHFTGSAAEYYLRETGLFPCPTVRHSSREGLINVNFKAMFDVFVGDDTLREHALAACFLQILTEVARSLKKDGENPLMRSLRFIDASYTEDIRIPELAAMENLSNSRYCALFKRYTGKSPIAYVIDLRLRHACELLRTTDMSVKQIGILVGYDDALFFSKLFKSKLGVTPTQYREN